LRLIRILNRTSHYTVAGEVA